MKDWTKPYDRGFTNARSRGASKPAADRAGRAEFARTVYAGFTPSQPRCSTAHGLFLDVGIYMVQGAWSMFQNARARRAERRARGIPNGTRRVWMWVRNQVSSRMTRMAAWDDYRRILSDPAYGATHRERLAHILGLKRYPEDVTQELRDAAFEDMGRLNEDGNLG